MKKLTLVAFAAISLSYGGGKGIAPAVVPAIPIAANESVSANPWYLGGGIVWMDFLKDPCSATDPSCRYEDVTYGAMLRGGYEFNEYFGIEGRVARTFLDEGPNGGAPMFHAGVFLKPQYPLTERFNAYALAGYGYTKNFGSGNRLNYFDDDWGFSAGAGIEYDLSGKKEDFLENATYDRTFDGHADQGRGWSLFLDYQRLLIKSDAPDLDMISAGLRYDF